jgi:hypothetical protein
MFGLEARVLEIERRLRKAVQDLADFGARLAAAEQQKLSGGAAPGAGGGGGGVYYKTGLVIAAQATITGVAGVKQSWSGADDSASATIHNVLPNATDGSKVQLLGKNPDGSYTVIAQSC